MQMYRGTRTHMSILLGIGPVVVHPRRPRQTFSAQPVTGWRTKLTRPKPPPPDIDPPPVIHYAQGNKHEKWENQPVVPTVKFIHPRFRLDLKEPTGYDPGQRIPFPLLPMSKAKPYSFPPAKETPPFLQFDIDGKGRVNIMPLPPLKELVAANELFLHGKFVEEWARYEHVRTQDASYPTIALVGMAGSGKTRIIKRLSFTQPMELGKFRAQHTESVRRYKYAPFSMFNKTTGRIEVLDVLGYGHKLSTQHIMSVGNSIFKKRKLVRGAVLAVSLPRGLSKFDRVMLREIASRQMPFVVLLNKAEMCIPMPSEEDFPPYMWHHLLAEVEIIQKAVEEAGAIKYIRGIFAAGGSRDLFYNAPVGMAGLRYAIARLGGLVGEDNWGKHLDEKKYIQMDTELDSREDKFDETEARIESFSPEKPAFDAHEMAEFDQVRALAEKKGLLNPERMLNRLATLRASGNTQPVSKLFTQWNAKPSEYNPPCWRKHFGPQRVGVLQAQHVLDIRRDYETMYGTASKQIIMYRQAKTAANKAQSQADAIRQKLKLNADFDDTENTKSMAKKLEKAEAKMSTTQELIRRFESRGGVRNAIKLGKIRAYAPQKHGRKTYLMDSDILDSKPFQSAKVKILTGAHRPDEIAGSQRRVSRSRSHDSQASGKYKKNSIMDPDELENLIKRKDETHRSQDDTKPPKVHPWLQKV